VTARPRSSAPVNRPIYKVRRYDTLRSIARDTLGDPRRASEILAINREVIDDPANLISGQLLELPDDADSRRVTGRGSN
jgi:nucleoid-associated protein YgaU